MAFSQQQVIPIFNGENYKFWSIKMKVVLQATQQLWDVVDKGIPQAEATPSRLAHKHLTKSYIIINIFILFYLLFTISTI